MRLGINQAKQILLVADGAEWIWQRIPPLLQRLGCSPESIHQLLDFYHVTEHLQKFAEAAITEPKERQAWFQQARCDLKLGKIVDLRRHYAGFEEGQLVRAPFNYDLPDWLFYQRAAAGTLELFSRGSSEVANWQWLEVKA